MAALLEAHVVKHLEIVHAVDYKHRREEYFMDMQQLGTGVLTTGTGVSFPANATAAAAAASAAAIISGIRGPCSFCGDLSLSPNTCNTVQVVSCCIYASH